MDDNRQKTSNLLNALNSLNLPIVWFWPNADAGSDEVSKAIRIFREKMVLENMHFLIYLPSDSFLSLLKKTACLIGNSSAGIKECSFLGTPTVNIGSRQNGRMRASNVTDVNHDADKIIEAVNFQLNHGPYEKSNIYFKESCSLDIAKTLSEANLSTKKEFYDNI